MIDRSVLASAVEWAQELSDADLKWHLMILAEDDPNIINVYKRKALMHETISRMGL